MLPLSTLAAAFTVLAMSASAYPITTDGSQLSSFGIPPASLGNDSIESRQTDPTTGPRDSASMLSDYSDLHGEELRTSFSRLKQLPFPGEASYSKLKDDVYMLMKAECEGTADFDLAKFNKDFEDSFEKQMEAARQTLSESNREEEEEAAKDGHTNSKRSDKDAKDTGIFLGSIFGFCALIFPAAFLGKWVVRRIQKSSNPSQPGQDENSHSQAPSQRRYTNPALDFPLDMLPPIHRPQSWREERSSRYRADQSDQLSRVWTLSDDESDDGRLRYPASPPRSHLGFSERRRLM
jgi:hypothetical protein